MVKAFEIPVGLTGIKLLYSDNLMHKLLFVKTLVLSILLKDNLECYSYIMYLCSETILVNLVKFIPSRVSKVSSNSVGVSNSFNFIPPSLLWTISAWF